MRRLAWLAPVASLLVACPKEQPAHTDAAIAIADAGDASSGPSFDGEAMVASACLSCHSPEMIAQQRLTQAQWNKVVTKMVTWGATLEPADVAPLVAYLSTKHALDGGAYAPATLSAAQAAEEIAPQDDGPFANGDAARGRPIYVDKCSGCHGAEARGHIGVLLVDRPMLRRASDFARVVRRGRGKMTPVPLSDAEMGDVLAYLRTLVNPAP
ncbi:MAG: c-type cytochrome [Labilithrix sp.]|nr:c-type cytochrome [Labilithrix sp.]